LKNFQINFNQVKRIEHVDKLDKLEQFWISDNKIEVVENLPLSIKSLWIANNFIRELDNGILNHKLEDLNLSGNLLLSFADIFILSKLKTLKSLSLSDPNFGDNPICSLNNYRVFMLSHLSFLEMLDEINITVEEKREVEKTYKKKNLYYKNKIKTYHNISKSLFTLIKSLRRFNTVYKTMRLDYLYKRTKLLEYLKQKDGENESIDKELENIKGYIEKCYYNLDKVKEYENHIKNSIIEINDLMIVK
jgi:hypothetical protein